MHDDQVGKIVAKHGGEAKKDEGRVAVISLYYKLIF